MRPDSVVMMDLCAVRKKSSKSFLGNKNMLQYKAVRIRARMTWRKFVPVRFRTNTPISVVMRHYLLRCLEAYCLPILASILERFFVLSRESRHP